MYRFLKDEGLIESTPFDYVKTVEEPETDISVMTVEQLKQLLQAPDQRSYAGFRDYVMMKTPFSN